MCTSRSRATPARRARRAAIMLTLDLSGSTSVPTTKFADLKRAATDTLDALECRRRQRRSHDRRQQRRHRDLSRRLGHDDRGAARIDYDTLAADISDRLGTPAGGSPHDAGINAASNALASSAGKAIVLITRRAGDGRSADGDEHGCHEREETPACASCRSPSARTRARPTSRRGRRLRASTAPGNGRLDQHDQAARRPRRADHRARELHARRGARHQLLRDAPVAS